MTTDVAKVKKVHAEMFDMFIDVCREHNLRWCCGYGTLIGAKREGGFIPWDHDVDVLMPYEDYKKLYDINRKSKVFPQGYYILDYNGSGKGMRNFKVLKKGTAILSGKKIIGRMFFDMFSFFNISSSDSCIKRISEISTEFKGKWIDRINNKIETPLSELIMNLENDIYNLKNEFGEPDCSIDIETAIGYDLTKREVSEEDIRRWIRPLLDFDNYEEIDFRGMRNKVRIPLNFDEFLTLEYGDWRTPVKTDDHFFSDTEHDIEYYRNINN